MTSIADIFWDNAFIFQRLFIISAIYTVWSFSNDIFYDGTFAKLFRKNLLYCIQIIMKKTRPETQSPMRLVGDRLLKVRNRLKDGLKDKASYRDALPHLKTVYG